MNSKTRKTAMGTLIVILAISIAHLIVAQPSSDNYILKKWAISSGGGSMSSDNYQAVAVIGQSSPPGVSTSQNYTLYSGFLQPIFVLPGEAVVWIWTDSLNVHIDWDDVPHANSYNIYRSSDPECQIVPGNFLGSTATSYYMDSGVVNPAGAKYFYRITCTN
jgi:hypothetical protein